MRPKKKELGGVEYMVLGSTINHGARIGQIVSKEYRTTKGKVVIRNGVVKHPDGTETAE